MAMAYSTSTRLAESDSENIPETNSEVSPSRRSARARAAPSSSSASLKSSESGRRCSEPSSSRTSSDSVCRKPERRFARYSSVACCTRARWFSMARESSSRKNSWIDWAERTFGSVIHTSSHHLAVLSIPRQVRRPLAHPLTAPGRRLHCPRLGTPLCRVPTSTARRKPHEDSASAGSRDREARARGGEDEGRHHHPRHREGEANRGPGAGRRERKGAGGRKGAPPGREGGRPGPLLEVRRDRDQGRRRGAPDDARGRHPRRHREVNHLTRHRRKKCPRKSCSTSARVRRCSRASTPSPTR